MESVKEEGKSPSTGARISGTLYRL